MPYRIGLAKTDITPPIGIFLSGYAARLEPSEDAYLPLTATAIAIEEDSDAALIVGAEILGFYERTERVRTLISERTGLSARQIVLCGSHTHCGPVLRETDRERHGALDDDYITRLCETIADIAQNAWETRESATLKFGTGTCDFAICRRMPDENGEMQMRPNPNGIVDHTVSVLAIESPDGAQKGVLFSYACHPTSRSGLLIGGDYVGFALQHVEASNSNVTACFVQGCAGDQKPRPVDSTSKTFDQRDIDQVRIIGEQLGDAVNAVLQSGQMEPLDGPLAMGQTTIELSMQPVDWARVASALQENREPAVSWAKRLQALRASGKPIDAQLPFEIQTLKLGSTFALVALAGEITVEYALRLKRELQPHFSHTLIGAYANAMVGYIPVKRQIPEGGYEVWANQYYLKRSGPFVAETEDHICHAVHHLLGTSA